MKDSHLKTVSVIAVVLLQIIWYSISADVYNDFDAIMSLISLLTIASVGISLQAYGLYTLLKGRL